MIKILFFAALREQLGCAEVELVHTKAKTLADVRNQVLDLHPEWREYLANEKLLAAVNHILVRLDHVVNEGDEVAFFPPVTGG